MATPTCHVTVLLHVALLVRIHRVLHLQWNAHHVEGNLDFGWCAQRVPTTGNMCKHDVQTVQPNPKWCFPITTATHCEYTAGACTNGWECRQQHRAAHTGLHTECMVNELCRQ